VPAGKPFVPEVPLTRREQDVLIALLRPARADGGGAFTEPASTHEIALAIVVYFLVQGLRFLRPSLFVTNPPTGVAQSGAGGFLDPLLGTLGWAPAARRGGPGPLPLEASGPQSRQPYQSAGPKMRCSATPARS